MVFEAHGMSFPCTELFNYILTVYKYKLSSDELYLSHTQLYRV